MLGAITGDIIGSAYEWDSIKTKDFDLFPTTARFTDDSVLTIAIADSILQNQSYKDQVIYYARKYPNAGYGKSFYNWFTGGDHKPYNSWGNGSAMRVSPIGFAFNSLEEVLIQSKKTAEITHNHPSGIKGAQATASAIYLARNKKSKDEIKQYIENTFNYNLHRSLDEIRPEYSFDVSCQGSVPESIIAFLESTTYEEAVRNAVSLGGDADTQACIAGAIAQAFYENIPLPIVKKVKAILPQRLWEITERFMKEFEINY